MMKRCSATVAALLALSACIFAAAGCRKASAPDTNEDFIRAGAPAGLPAGASEAVSAVGEKAIAAHVKFLADPAREGRGLGTKGLDAAAEYIAGRLKTFGIPPLGRSYYQEVPIREVRPASGLLRLAGIELRGGRDAALPEAEPGVLSGTAVFCGYAIREPELKRDDLSGLDVKGKIAVFIAGVPDGPEWRKAGLLDKYAPAKRPEDRYDARLDLLDELGAKAAVALEPGLARGFARGKEREYPYFLAAPGAPDAKGLPLARAEMSPALLSALRAAGTFPVKMEVRGEVRPMTGRNVLAVLPGSDPRLRGEAVIIGAHMDHLGVRDGAVYPGADDNASGVSALLEIARAASAARTRPKRTLIFAFWTGEEEGKFGSGDYVGRPLWPLAATKAYLNLDMIGHPWTRAELDALADGAKTPQPWLKSQDPAYFAELGLPRQPPGNGPLLARAALGAGMSVHLDRTDGLNGGSDYRWFARRKVFFVRFFGDFFPQYHSPGDTAAALDAGQVRRIARLCLASAWLLADD